MEKVFSHISESQTKEVVDFVLGIQPRPNVITLSGDLGAGKTSLIKKIIASLGCTDTVTSPTFGLVNEYKNPDGSSLYHSDWYRIKHTAELIDAGMDELLDLAKLMIVEWPEIGESLLPSHRIHIEIEHELDTRTYRINYT